MTHERKDELRDQAARTQSFDLTECLAEIDRLEQALQGVPFPAVEIDRIRREQMETDCKVLDSYAYECPIISIVKAVGEIRRVFEEQGTRQTCEHANKNYADLMRRLAETTPSNDAEVLEETQQ